MYDVYILYMHVLIVDKIYHGRFSSIEYDQL